MSLPRISVVIPVYNIAPYLSQCLDSLIRQTYSAFEVICVDDASTDDSAKLIQSYRERDSRIRLLSQPHQGVSAARNLGIRQAKGDYILFVDGDDWCEESMLQALLHKADETDSDVVICSSRVHFEQQNLSNARRRSGLQAALTVSEGVWDSSADSTWEMMTFPGVWPFVWNKLIRRTVLTDHGIDFPASLALGEDGVFLHLLFQYAKKVAFIPQFLYHYRYQRKESATDNLFSDQVTRFRQHTKVIAVMLQAFQTRALLDGCKAAFLKWSLEFLYGDFVHLPASRRQEAAGHLRELFLEYGLMDVTTGLNRIHRRRLQIITDTDSPITEKRRVIDILYTKIENRLLRYFFRRDS